MLRVGDEAPDFSLKSEKGETISLTQFRERSPVVLYFYPRDNTPGCTKEACAFQNSIEDFRRMGVAVLGISCDSEESHRKFKQSYGLLFPLLSDEDRSVSKAFGVYKEKNMYGRKVMSIERTTFVIDKMGRIAHLFRRVRVTRHVERVLEAIGKLDL